MGDLDPQLGSQAAAPADADPALLAADGGTGGRNILALTAVLGTGALELLSGGTPAQASVNYQCNNVLAPGYNTIVCHVPKRQAEQYCDEQAIPSGGVFPVFAFKAAYSSTTGSESDRVSFGVGDIHGCDPVGTRRATAQMQVRDGATGTFANVGKPFTITGNTQHKPKATLSGPVNCATEAAGSAVRTAVTVTFLPRKQFLRTAKPKHSTGYSPAKPIC